jgi:hypothetical protein
MTVLHVYIPTTPTVSPSFLPLPPGAVSCAWPVARLGKGKRKGERRHPVAARSLLPPVRGKKDGFCLGNASGGEQMPSPRLSLSPPTLHVLRRVHHPYCISLFWGASIALHWVALCIAFCSWAGGSAVLVIVYPIFKFFRIGAVDEDVFSLLLRYLLFPI